MASDDAPIVAGKAPKGVEVKKGQKYRWCSCGRSKNQPFYDEGSCTSYCDAVKVEFVPEEDAELHLCMCKATKNRANGHCDGTHRKLKEKVGDKLGGGGGSGAEKKTPDIEDLVGGDADPDDGTEEEPTLGYIKTLARGDIGHHGPMVSMGVPRPTLPQWDDIQFVTAQLARRPLMETVPVDTRLVVGPRAKKPLTLEIPLFVSDMSYGALSREAKIALSTGAEMAGTGICSGEGGSLPAERNANSRYFLEVASALFGINDELLSEPGVRAVHFKFGQGAKTGTGGHLPGKKVTAEIAQIRNLPPGADAVSPPTFAEDVNLAEFVERIREMSGGVPVGAKLSAQRVEDDIDAALALDLDYIILDGRGGGTGAAPQIFRDHISVPTIPALARARRHLDKRGASHVTLIATGGLRTPMDFLKAMALGADGVAVANSAIQSIGCVAARMCSTGACPTGVATQRPDLRKLLDVDKGARQLNNFFRNSVKLMSVMARACGHDALSKMGRDDIVTWKRDMRDLAGVPWAGVRDD